MAISRFWKSIKLKKATETQTSLTVNQTKYIDRFLVTSTRQFLDSLEILFMIAIDSSTSHVEIMPTSGIEKMERLNSGFLYVIPSELQGEMQGNLHLLMRFRDFNNLGEVLKPTMEFLNLSGTDSRIATQISQETNQVQDINSSYAHDADRHEQLMDALTEMGNSLFGIYTNAFYKTFDLYTHHSPLESLRDSNQMSLQQLLLSPKMKGIQHFMIENEIFVKNKIIRLWCLISPTRKSFQEILNRIG